MGKPSTILFGKRTLTAGGFVTSKYNASGIRAINSTGSSIAADKLVAVIGYNTTSLLPKIVLADADVATHTDVYVTLAAIADGSEGYIYKGGLSAANLDTSGATTVGDPLYLDTTAGGFTSTAPTGADDRVVPVGWSTVKSSTVGQIHWHVGVPEKWGEDVFQSGMTVNAPIGTIATEVVSATNVITAAESGTTFFLNSATEFASTLPVPAAGLFYRFIVTAAPSQASYTVATNGSAACQILAGHVLTSDVYTDSAVDADAETAATGTTITFVDGISVVGDMAEVWCDGTSWFASCRCAAVAGITITG